MEKIPDIVHLSWHPHLQFLFDDPKMNLIKDKLLYCKLIMVTSDNNLLIFNKL